MTMRDSYFVVQAFSLQMQPERLHHKRVRARALSRFHLVAHFFPRNPTMAVALPLTPNAVLVSAR
jgi:hypothetical protein